MTRKKSYLTWAGLGLAALVLCLVIVMIIDLPGRLGGTADTAASAIPADAALYFGFDLLQLRPEKLNLLVQPYMAGIEKAKFGSADGLLVEIDRMLLDPLGIDFAVDIQPWLGQYLGIGITGDPGQESTYDRDGCGITAAVEALNITAADEFIARLVERQPGGSGREVQIYQGATIYRLPAIRMAIARSKNLVIFAACPENIRAAIDAQNGQSIHDLAVFQQLSRVLPGGRFLTAYAGGEGYRKLLTRLTQSGDLDLSHALEHAAVLDALAAGATIEQAGLRIDIITGDDPAKLADNRQNLPPPAAPLAQIARDLPAATFLLTGDGGLNAAGGAGDEPGEASGLADLDRALHAIQEATGIKLKANDLQALRQALAGAPLSIRLRQGCLAIGAGQPGEQVGNPPQSLGENIEFSDVWSRFEQDVTPILYFDLPDLLEAIQANGDLDSDSFAKAEKLLKPLHHIAGGVLPLEDNRRHTIILIDI